MSDDEVKGYLVTLRMQQAQAFAAGQPGLRGIFDKAGLSQVLEEEDAYCARVYMTEEQAAKLDQGSVVIEPDYALTVGTPLKPF